MNWMVSADLPTPPPPTTTSRYFSWPEPSRQPAAAMGTPPSPARPRRAAARPRPGSGDLCGRRAEGERPGGGPGRRELLEGRSGRQRGARAGRVPAEARRSEVTAAARGCSVRGAHSCTRLRSACRTQPPAQLQMAVWGPGRQAEVLHMHEGAGRGGAGPRWPGLRFGS